MALDWSNERYVRLYRPSVDHRALCWQARAIWPLLMQEADGAGVIGARKGVAGVAKAIDFPPEVVEAGIADLLDDGCLVTIPGGYCIRNYVEAQTATMTDSSRKARQREVDRALAALASAASIESQAGPQIGHAASREVTNGHGASRSVTPSRAEPSREEDLSHRAREGQADPGAGRDVPGRPSGTPPARGDDSILALVTEAAAALTAARRELDAGAPPIDDSTAGAVTQRLMATPAADRRQKLMHAVACVVARAKATRSIEPLRWSTFGSEQAWAYVVDASVSEYARSGQRPGHGARDSPRHQSAPPARRTPIRDL